MTIDERLQALAETELRTFELVSTVAQEVETMPKNVDRNMQVLIQYAHRYENWLEQLEKRNGGGR